MLDKNTLAKLFTHTINFFHFIATRSSALNTELDMLIRVRKMLELGEADPFELLNPARFIRYCLFPVT